MKKTHTTKTLRLFLLLAALCPCAPAAAQPKRERAKAFEPTAAQRAEASRMRGALAGALGESFEVERGRLTRRSAWHGGALYWLARLRAKAPGEFHVTYKYRYTDRVRPQDPLYNFVEHETFVRVGPAGCDRRPRSNFICVGDAIILPVLVGEHTEHSFSAVARPFAPGDAASAKLLRDAEDARLHGEPVNNPAARFMRYVGSRAHYSPHRALGYTVTYYATFEAVAPGAFNLAVGSGASNAGPTDPARLSAAGGSVPVVVVARGAPVTALSSGDNVHGYTERFSSRGGNNNYLTTPVILQTGERLTLQYLSYSVRGRSAGGENRETIEASVNLHPPAVSLLPFRFDPAQDFNEWLAEFLPAAAAP